MSEIDARIHTLQQSFTRETLQKMFTDRRADEMFASIGQDASSKSIDGLEAIWYGYETVTDSKYLI